jgi:hypothetical protein
MLPKTPEILAREGKTEKAGDSFNRVIVCGRLKPSQEMAVIRFADSDDAYIRFTYRVAASVRAIGDAVYPFPRDRAELESVLDTLDREGLEAASTAFLKIYESEKEAVGGDAAKNSP